MYQICVLEGRTNIPVKMWNLQNDWSCSLES